VLSLVFSDDGVDLQLVGEDAVREMLRVRQEGGVLCDEGQSDPTCTPMNQIVPNAIFPPPTIESDVFTITAEVQAGDVRRAIEAVVDIRQEATPLLLSWRVL
jgi:hypothetical protein